MFSNKHFSKIFLLIFLINYLTIIFVILYLFILNKLVINYEKNCFCLIVLLILFSCCMIFLFYKIIFYSEEDRKTKECFIKNELYMIYGKNIIGAIHNIKNKLTPIYLLLNEVKDDKNIDLELKKFTEEQLSNSNGIIDLLNELLYLVKIEKEKSIEDININYLILSMYELFKINLDFKNNVNFKIVKIGKDLIIKINSFELMQIIEMIIRDAWNNVKNIRTEKEIIITINSVDKYLLIENNGCLNKKEKDDMLENKKNFINNILESNKIKIREAKSDDLFGYKLIFKK